MSDPVTLIRSPVSLDFTHTADPATATYLAGLGNKLLIGGRCPSCKRVMVPLRSVCPICAVGPMVPLELPETGEVSTFCVINIPFPGQVLTPPYACAHVTLDGADVQLFHLVGECPPDQVTSGMRVQAVWNDDPEAIGHARLKYFKPIEGS
jgi:uncharacterized protein